ncbi:MAG: 8-amino-7-oxononanoate synthase, partial [Bacteroidota bacterium]|nr:8-amino-7-oxononanoate synthase [Bacteroidota bacterium]
TALPLADVNAIATSYNLFPALTRERDHLFQLVNLFKEKTIKYRVIKSDTPIQGIIIPGNDEVKKAAQLLQENNFDVRPILYPSVPKGQERLRVVLHSFNLKTEVQQLTGLLNSC